jgi:hypothetical protein
MRIRAILSYGLPLERLQDILPPNSDKTFDINQRDLNTYARPMDWNIIERHLTQNSLKPGGPTAYLINPNDSSVICVSHEGMDTSGELEVPVFFIAKYTRCTDRKIGDGLYNEAVLVKMNGNIDDVFVQANECNFSN